MSIPSETIDEFCIAEHISRGMYYKLKRMGKGPREMAVGTHKRISPEAHADWRREREAEAEAEAEGAQASRVAEPVAA